MAAVNRASARGEQRFPINFRSGLDGWKWRGMVPDGDPASIGLDRLRLVINGTYRFGQVLARGGQRPLMTTPIHNASACIKNLFDFPLGTPRRLTILGDGCPDVSSSVGFSANFYDQEQSPQFQPGVYYNGSTVGLAAGVFGGSLYFGDDLSLRRFNPIRPPYGTKQLAISGPGQDTLIYTFGSGTSISALSDGGFDGKLFIALDNGASSLVYYFDGVTIFDDKPTLTDKVQRFATFRDKLVLGFDGTPNNIQVRDIGVAPGTYATVAPGAGTINFWRAASYKDVLYITTNDENLYSFDGTTLTQIPVATTGLPANANTWGITTAFGNLYVAYEDVTAGHAEILQYDGSTWTPSVKNLTTQVATLRAALDLVYYRDSLVVAVKNATNIYSLYSSPVGAATGTWAQTTQSSGASGPINELLIY